MTVNELLERMSSRELSEWMAFYKIEPWGAQIDFLGHAQTAATVANVHRGEKSKAFTAEDFMPKFGNKQENQTTQEMKQALQSWSKALGDQE